MPEQPLDKRSRQVQDRPALSVVADAPAYAELHCKTNFSFLEGASHPDELVLGAAELGYAALAITDRNSLAGVVRARGAAKQIGIKLLIGAEITPVDAPPIVLWATGERGLYGRLSRLITCGRRRAEKGECQLTFDDVAAHAAGLLAGVLPIETGAPLNSPSVHCPPPTDHSLFRYREVFGDRGYLLAEQHHGPDDARQLQHWKRLAKRVRLPLAAAGGVHFHHPAQRPLCDVLTAIRAGCTVAEAGELLFPNAERYLKSPAQMAELFADAPETLDRTVEIAARCTFSLDELRYEYPEELAPPGQTPLEHLTRLTWGGARERYPGGVPDKVRHLIDHELQIIADLHYEAYFLTVWDLVRFARSKEILCQGRGSAANSAVCYCLGVTAVDPELMEVLFERFVSRERNEAPDIDVDFEHERREEVLQYLYEKYGRERCGMTAEVITYRYPSAVRDVGKALGLSLDRVDALAKALDHPTAEPRLENRCRLAGLAPDSPLGQQLVTLVGQLVSFPRHLSQHVGGMVLTQGPLCELVPIENAAMEGRTVIEWDKDDLDELGILKVDCLALGMLTAIRKCFALIKEHEGRELTLATVPQEDQAVYEMTWRADTMGVFQIESRAQMSMLPRLKPEKFYDLVIQVAIVRPGPIQGGMVHPYLRRRAGDEEVTYPNKEIEEVLERTLGVPLFQEQAMQLAVVAAGFTPGEADQLRRAMGAWRRPGLIDDFRKKLMDGMQKTGLSEEFAERVFNQIRGFGEYGFPESHAASFAKLVYVSAWLKCYYPAAFAAALINSQPMGFYAPAQLVRNAREHGVEVRPIDVNHSRWDCTLESGQGTVDSGQDSKLETQNSKRCLRLGLRLVSGLSTVAVATIEQAQAAGPFRSVAEFARRTGLKQPVITRLAGADAFGSLGLDRRGSLWQALGQEKQARVEPLFAGLEVGDESAALPVMSPQEEVIADYDTAGLSLKAHPLSFFRGEMDRLGIVPAEWLTEMPADRFVRVAGLVLVRQRPSTAKGITFITLEDETGTANLIVHLSVWDRYYRAARRAPALIATGRLQKQGQVIHVLVSQLESLPGRLSEMKSVSRDFQ